MSSTQPSKNKESKEKREEKKEDKREEKRVEEKKEDKREEKRQKEEPTNSDAGSEYTTDSEYDELDLTDNPMYQVLSAFFEDEDGHNMCDHIKELTEAVRENTKMLSKYIKESESAKKRH